MRLTTTTDLTTPVTRQHLTDMWEDATVPSPVEGDLSDGFQTVFVGSDFSAAGESLPSPYPGKLFWHQGFGIMYCWHDMIDVLDDGSKTGVSLWLAVGPDSFETACIAAEPIPAGAAVEPFFDRWVKVSAGSGASNRPIGISQSGIPVEYDPAEAYGSTAASGDWIRVGIDGYVRFWHPAPDSGVSEAHFALPASPVRSAWVNHFDGKFKGAGIRGPSSSHYPNSALGLVAHNVTIPSGYTAVYPFLRFGE